MSVADGGGRIPSWPGLRAFAEHSEAIGLDSVWVCDHFLSAPPGGRPEGIHEGWTVLSALAASTDRIELGQLVMCVSFRNPALLAKMAATADTISGGRLVLGLGAGWYDAEYEAYGYPTDQRLDRFDEALQVIRPLVRGERVTFEGRHHQVRNASLLPLPERPIPILVAANRPRMLRLAARYGDAWNTAWYGLPDDRLKRRTAEFDAALEAEGRQRSAVRRTVGMQVDETGVNALREAIHAYEALGFDDLILGLEPMNVGSLERLGDALG
jgi:probable F420-dependent oxidoreductase